MMKKIIVIFTFLILTSCHSKQPEYIEGFSQTGTSGANEIRYFKDKRTGLCFAERGTLDSYAFTCVPCDSVKNLIK